MQQPMVATMPLTELVCNLQQSVNIQAIFKAATNDLINVYIQFIEMTIGPDLSIGSTWSVTAHGRACIFTHQDGGILGADLQTGDEALLHHVQQHKDADGNWVFTFVPGVSNIIMQNLVERPKQGILDIGCGLGLFSVAARLAGYKVVDAIDSNANMTMIYNKIHDSTTATTGDLNDWSIIAQLGRRNAQGMTLGFSCQPYSASGLQQGHHDRRDITHAMVRAIWALNLDFGVLECVSEFAIFDSGKNLKDLTQALDLMGYKLFTHITQLRDIRPMFSKRWTAHFVKHATAQKFREHNVHNMLPPYWQVQTGASNLADIGLRPFMESSWPDSHIQQLRWSLAEINLYSDPDLLPDRGSTRMITPNSTLGRPMHRQVSHAVPCQCGCGPPLSIAHMKQKGGCFAKGMVNNGTPCHIHPYIQAVTMAAPAAMRIPDQHLRLVSALLGNAIAVPQVLFVSTLSMVRSP